MTTSDTASGTRSWRSLRGPALVGLLLVLATVVGLLATAAPSGRHDPEATGPVGARAVANVAESLGAEVTRVRGSSEALEVLQSPEGAGGDAVLVVVDTYVLSDDALESLADRAPDVRLVLVEPTPEALDALAPGTTSRGPAAVEVLEPGCDLPAARRAGPATAGGDRYAVDGDATSCYSSDGLGSVVQLDPDDGAPVTLVGAGELLTNDGLDEEGDAALALGLLEGAEQVVWLYPDPLAAVEDEGTQPATELLPPVVGLVLLQVGVAVVLLALWRARRLGPPVSEPLPVVVRAAEVVEGRARLYRAGGARDVAAEALRDAARARLLPLLGLGSTAGGRASEDRDRVVEAVAARTGDDRGRVGSLLYGAPPADDAALGRLAAALDGLESAVRGTVPAPRAHSAPRPTEGPRP